MGCTDCVGRYGLMVFSVLFVLGVMVSTTSPSWISTTVANPLTGTTLITEYGPFNTRDRNCTTGSTDEVDCTEWETRPIDKEDCTAFTDIPIGETGNQTEIEIKEEICRQNTTWRALAEICVLIVMGTAILVALATTTQCITCGCCGGSFDQLAMVLCWIEVILSIVCWSFAISVVTMIRGVDATTLFWDEVDTFSHIDFAEFTNITGVTSAEAAVGDAVTDITSGNFLWGFWLFMISGTVCGALCATFAGWAAEGSLLKCVCSAIIGFFKCIFCIK